MIHSTTRSVVFGLLAGLFVAGCSGGGSGSSSGSATPAATETGEVTVAVTDAATDEIDTFEVDIVSFRFEKTNGAIVEILPQTARVDFAQLVTVSEVIAAATLPTGSYERAYMTLDFGSAAVRISGNTGNASLVDGSSQPLTGREELEIVFPNGGFVVGARRGYFAEIDFDLDQSLTVDAAGNRVTVDTVLYASVNPAQPKSARVPGLASSFSGSTFDLDVRIGLGLVSRGALSVQTSGSTVYDMGGTVQTGAAGFSALQALGDNTLVVVAGTVDPARKTLTASAVVLLPQDLDEVGGLVVARSGGPGSDATLTLKGVAVRRQNGSVTFNDTVTIQTSLANTKVNKRSTAAGTLTVDAINVGQRILAYGRFNGSSLDLTQSGAGFVRLVQTDLRGEAVAPASGGTLDLKVHRIGVRKIAAFTPAVESVAQWDPDALRADTGGLGLSSIATGSPVIATGFFAPVSSTTAAVPFDADTVIDRTNAASLIRLWWLPASVAPIASSDATSLTLDITGTLFKQVDRGLVAPTTLTANPTITGNSTAGFFAVRRGFTLTLFTTWSSFKAHLEAQVTGGARMIAFRAVGKYDVGTNTLTAARAHATLR